MSDSTTIVLSVPDLASMTDDQIAAVARGYDGKWSTQTRHLLAESGCSLLDLNANWAATWTGWQCPCCGRDKRSISRVSEGNVLLCRLELHHDHLEKRVKAIFEAFDPRGDADGERIRQRSDTKHGLLVLVERFRPAMICMDCNSAEGEAKRRLSGTIDADFSFSPKEIARFIKVAPNRKHDVDLIAAEGLWTELKEDYDDRVAFAGHVARRFAEGRHRREDSSRSHMMRFEDRNFLWALATEAAPGLLEQPLSLALATRSVSNDSAFTSPRPPLGKQPMAGPTEDEFAAIVNGMQTGRRTWDAAGESWSCPCCDRTKHEICRKSGSKIWTAQIHWVQRWERESDETNLTFRAGDADHRMVLGGYEIAFLCHDCRNVVTKTRQKAGDRFAEDCLTLEDIRALVHPSRPHRQHDFDIGAAIGRAEANTPLADAIRDFAAHSDAARTAAELHTRMTHFQGFNSDQAKAAMAVVVTGETGMATESALDRVAWLIGEGQRLNRLEARQKAIRTGSR